MGQTEHGLDLLLPQQGCEMGMTHDRCVHTVPLLCHTESMFIGIMSLPAPFPVVAVARTANQTGEQAELSLFPGGSSHLLFLSLPLGQTSTGRPSLPAVPREAVGPQAPWGAPSNGV